MIEYIFYNNDGDVLTLNEADEVICKALNEEVMPKHFSEEYIVLRDTAIGLCLRGKDITNQNLLEAFKTCGYDLNQTRFEKTIKALKIKVLNQPWQPKI